MKKMLGDERRQYLFELLKQADGPLKGTELAKLTNVSRQVIVNDMNLLKARNEPIMATSQGYIYMPATPAHTAVERKIVCLHDATQTKEELYAIVDCGVTVKNVSVEHSVYGEITASMMVSNRLEVDDFLARVTATQSSLLSSLTDGTYVHVLTAPTAQQIDMALANLRALGILVEG